MTSIADPPIRRLDETDVAACVALAEKHGWPPEPGKWSLLMRVGEVYGIGDDELIGTVALVRYGDGFAVVSMMVVSPEHTRRGHGRRLMAHVLRAARRCTLALYATAAGRPLYLDLGFRTIGWSSSYLGVLDQGSGQTRVAAATDLAAIAAADRAAFGGDRLPLLRRWASEGRWLRVAERADRIAGFAGAWRSREAQTLIGPVVADDLATATSLITDLAADAGGQVRLDVDRAVPGLEAWALAQGMIPSGPAFPLMTVDGEPLPGDRGRVFAPIGSALG
ncbi:GNAT family N-acetyltransferase [Labedaea rhizosphaerae]|uniref:GNAT family N-acetyltransferase n=1 Tax=Labedaea rhizosphaerae TaxID=598644 RepID=UPI00141502DC|nr:GNAT family N-acetyltransferase [Labedaea rhizosphaerae]